MELILRDGAAVRKHGAQEAAGMNWWGRIVVVTAACAGAPCSGEGPVYPDHGDLSYVAEADGARTPIRSEADWSRRRAHVVLGIQRAMGPLPRPERPIALDVQVVEERRDDGLLWRKLAYRTDRANQRVAAWLLRPEGAETRPAILCLHQTTPSGKDACVGLADRPSMHYALELARRGYVTLSPDYPSLGEYAYDFEADDYASGSMKAIYDNRRAVDLLASLPEVDAERIGCIGHSLGGHNGLFTAAFDKRLKAVVASCGFTRFARYQGGDLTGWSGPRYMPRVAAEFGKSAELMPFDFGEVLAAIAPRSVFVVAPLKDDNFDVVGVREAVATAEPVYRLLGAASELRAVYPNCGHDFPDEARRAAYAFLDERLATEKSPRQ
jgi:acetyl esterase/lipase